MLYYKIKNQETFKDGNIFGDRVIKPHEILIVTEIQKQRMEQSGAAFDVLETLVPNPFKRPLDAAGVVAKVEAEKVVDKDYAAEIKDTPALTQVGNSPKLVILTPEVPETPKKKAGRPKKVVHE